MDKPATGQAAPMLEDVSFTSGLPEREATGDVAGVVTRDIVVVGASAGGVSALQRLAGGLPPDYRGSVFIVMHTSPEAHSVLPAILRRAGQLPAVHASDDMPIEPGHLYVAPPDHHLLLEQGRLVVVRGPRENRHRPAIDPLFRCAAWAYGPRVVGVVLTGNLDDGTAGLWAIKSCGGLTIVQDPDDAENPQMPMNALLHNRIDLRLRLDQIAAHLVELASQPIETQPQSRPPASLHDEIEYAKMNRDLKHTGGPSGRPSAFTCPSCRGALWELDEGGHLRYRCHTGHAYSQASLLVEQGLAMEEGLYAALRAVEEKAAALRRLAERWPEHIPGIKQDYEDRALALDQSADTLRAMLAKTAP
jgi:two-component system chemotaxis response regulator CheB